MTNTSEFQVLAFHLQAAFQAVSWKALGAKALWVFGVPLVVAVLSMLATRYFLWPVCVGLGYLIFDVVCWITVDLPCGVWSMVRRFVLVLWGLTGGVVSWQWKLYRLRVAMRDVSQAGSFEVAGTVSWDLKGPYILVQDGSRSMKVRIDSGAFMQLLMGNQQKPQNESFIPTSLVLRSPLPSSQVLFYVEDQIVGSGFRTTVKGEDVIVTAYHVLHTLRMSGGEKYIGTAKSKLPLDKSYGLKVVSPQLDVAVFKVPVVVFSTLGVAKATLARMPGHGEGAEVSGFIHGISHKASGAIHKIMPGFRFQHTATSVPGFSGAPIFCGGKVIGIHLRGDVTYNVGVSTDVFLSRANSPTKEKGYREEDYEEWFNSDDEYVQSSVYYDDRDPEEFLFKGKVYAAHPNPGAWGTTSTAKVLTNFGQNSWADYDGDMDFSGNPFDESVFPQAPKVPLEQALGSTNGENSARKNLEDNNHGAQKQECRCEQLVDSHFELEEDILNMPESLRKKGKLYQNLMGSGGLPRSPMMFGSHCVFTPASTALPPHPPVNIERKQSTSSSTQESIREPGSQKDSVTTVPSPGSGKNRKRNQRRKEAAKRKQAAPSSSA